MTYESLVSDTKFLITGDSTADIDYTAADILRNINSALNKVQSIIMRADGRWQFDDNNFTTLPVATTTMYSGQADYEISSGSFLNIERVEMLDENGNGVLLQPINYSDVTGEAMTEFGGESGTPKYYDKTGNSFILYPTPNYGVAKGLTAYFQREPHYFISTDTTAEPGFNALYHRYLSLSAALDYTIANDMNKSTSIKVELGEMEAMIIADFSKRNKDYRPRLSTYKEGYGQGGRGIISENKIY